MRKYRKWYIWSWRTSICCVTSYKSFQFYQEHVIVHSERQQNSITPIIKKIGCVFRSSFPIVVVLHEFIY